MRKFRCRCAQGGKNDRLDAVVAVACFAKTSTNIYGPTDLAYIKAVLMSFVGWAAAGDGATQSADVEAAVIDAVMAREPEGTGAAMHVEQSAAVAAVMARIPDTGAYKFEAELVPRRAFEARASTVALGFVNLFCTQHYMPKNGRVTL